MGMDGHIYSTQCRPAVLAAHPINNNNNNKHAYAGELNSITHLRALLLLHPIANSISSPDRVARAKMAIK
jgi:hypothetical protein